MNNHSNSENTANYPPLVSIAVITYNSEKTVIETLESVKDQTYDNIELIVSDDCSSDRTVQICREWINCHKTRFARTQLIETSQNTGISGNCNRAEMACQGKWVKTIAGDDLLMPNSIESYLDYVIANPDTIIVFGKCVSFGGNIRQRRTFDRDIFKTDFYNLSAQEQFAFLLTGNCIPASTGFYDLQKMRDLGVTYDERIPLIEDWPRWLTLTNKGVHLSFIDKTTVKYRLGGISSANLSRPSLAYYRSSRLFDHLYRYPLSCQNNTNDILDMTVDYECRQYKEFLNVFRTREYRIGNFLLSPFKKIAHIIRTWQER